MTMKKTQEVKVKDGWKFIVMGSSLRDNDMIRVYQVGGDTKTIQPGWKTFRTDRMNDFRVLGGTFNEPRPLFNPTGDRSMKRIYKITQF